MDFPSKQQRAGLVTLLKRSALRALDFVWREGRGDWAGISHTVPAVLHTPTDYYFTFGEVTQSEATAHALSKAQAEGGGPFSVEFWPNHQMAIGSHKLLSWHSLLGAFDQWLTYLATAYPQGVVRKTTEPASTQLGVYRQAHGNPLGPHREPLKVFISYSHEDERMRVRLDKHLKPLVDDGLVCIWHDREIEAGANWEEETNNAIGEADIILLLVSAPFLNSPNCRKELLRAIDQRSAGKSLPIPIILRPCDWTSMFNRGDYKSQVFPRDGRPVAGGRWPNQDAAFAAVAKELRTKIERMRG